MLGFKKIVAGCCLALGALSALPVQAAFEPTGTRHLFAVLSDGSETEIGEIKFSDDANGESRFEMHLDHSKFTDYFLSMREFKCLFNDSEVSCHVPYPYKSPMTVSPDNYTWLEHRLMFLFKKPKEFGAKLWNGIYYKFTAEGDQLVGRPLAVDLNEIGAPPEDLTIPPYQDINRFDMDASQRLIQELRIR